MPFQSKPITANVIQAMPPTAEPIKTGDGGDVCRYFFDFNGDGYIETSNRWNPDAVNTDFEIEVACDTSNLGTIFTQSSASVNELRFFVFNSDIIGTRLCGTIQDLTLTGNAGYALWGLRYEGSTISLIKNGVVIDSATASIGADRDATVTRIASNIGSSFRSGFHSNFKMWINGIKSTGDLVANMPIDDNSNTIIDYSSLGLDGVLSSGTGQWVEVCQSFEDGEDYIDTYPWID